MRKIHNNHLLKQTFQTYKDILFQSRDFVLPKVALADLMANPNRAALYEIPEAKIDLYIGKIIAEYDDIIMADQSAMKNLMKAFALIIPVKDITKAFWQDIVDAMRYNALREKEYIRVIQKLNIKTCIYCHAQLTVVMAKKLYERNYKDLGVSKGDVREYRALLELDHRHPKSKYPYLSTSFYNLYPVCGNCNRVKSSKTSSFDLYSEDEQLEVFTFSIDKASSIECLSKQDSSLIKINIDPVNMDAEEAEKYLEMFDIREIYDTQKDLVEELLYKKKVYSERYKKELLEEFPELFTDPSIIDRLLIGNYDQPEDVHRRPMAKFVQDIARDIELIPKRAE
jgi:hypothetical protein